MCLAIPGEILNFENTDPLDRTARVRFGGIVKTVSLVLLPDAVVGQYVLVHAGIGITVIDEDEAARTFTYLEELGALEDAPEGPT